MKLYYRQKWNKYSRAWTIEVKTLEEKQNETLNKFKKLLGL